VKVAIVGAGAGGLSAAYDLVRAGCEVIVLEASDHVGGLASGFKIPRWDWSVERYYHHWFASDTYILDLIDELGWSDRAFFPWPATGAYYDGRFYPLDGPLSLIVPGLPWLDHIPGAGTLSRGLHALRFPGLTWGDKIRFGLASIYLLLSSDWRPFESVTAHEWLRRWMGPHGYEVLWEPLLIGKFGPHYKDVNMAWFWARVKARTPRLGTFEGGFQAFMDEFAQRLDSMGVALRLRTPVEMITAAKGGGVSLTAADETIDADHCLVTTSPALLAKLAPDLPDSYLHQLLSMDSLGAVVLVIALTRRLSDSGIYWHNLPKSSGFPFLALVEHTNFLSPRFFGGDHIVYCGDYLKPNHEYFSLTKEELLARFEPALARVNPEFTSEWVREAWLFKTPYAQPVPPVNHSRAIPDLKTPIPGLWLASMSQVYPWDRGTNYAVEIGRRAARRILAEDGTQT
jgi:protoporphyrinogen oxidase